MTVAIKFIAEADLKALGKADKKLNTFGKSAVKIGKSLALAFGTTAILAYGKASVKAYAADDKAARILSRSLDNLGLHFADPRVKQFISDLEKQYGVLDDYLRPAYQKLLTTTGDYLASQDLLKTALDLSAMSGADVVSVAGDLAKAYAGNTRGLIKYGLGLSKTELAAMSFQDILKQIAKVSGGQATTAADSFSGSLAKLQVAGANASETIGKSLVQALTDLGGTGGLPKTISLIESLASGIGDAIIGTGRLVYLLSKISLNPFDWSKISNESTAIQKKWRQQDMIEKGLAFPSSSTGFSNLMQGQATAKAAEAAKKAAAAKILADKKAAALKVSQDKKAASDKKVLSKGNTLFDLEQIGIVAALKMSIDKETRLRLELLKAIQLEDIDLIASKMKELASWESLNSAQKLSGVTTITEKQLSGINTTLLTELAAINASKMSDAEKNAARTAAWTKYNDEIKFSGGLAALETYSQKTQDQELQIQKLASVYKISAARTAAAVIEESQNKTKIEQNKVLEDAVSSSIKTLADKQEAADLARQAALEIYIKSLSRIIFPTPPVIPPIIPPVIPPKVPPIIPPIPDNPFPGIGSDKDTKDNQSLIGAGGVVLNFNAPITTTSSQEFASAVQKAIQNNNRYGNNLDYAGAI